MSEATLPALRQELRLQPGAPLTNGAPSWTLFDPLRHMFFRLGEIEFAILHGWATKQMDAAVATLRARGLNDAALDHAFNEVVDFALSNQLTVAPQGDATAAFAAIHEARRRTWWRSAFDNYLFFRVPLVRPAAWLQRNLPLVEPLYSRTALFLFLGLALINLWFVGRQFDQFWATFLNFLSWDGLAAYAIGLSAVKVVHELGHAFTTTRFGARVPTMGVSFLLMFPVLYTDTTGAWAITSRKRRLAIDVAGVTAELMCAVLCTTAWLLLPDGALRSTAFVLATSSWVLSVGININPFMRFDGYYLLSDLINVPNLQARSFALMGWSLRRHVFGLPDAPPEQLSAGLTRGLIVYAVLTAVYRLFLFGGIALLLYLTLFKPLGLILAAIEIGVFIVRPVVTELGRLWGRRKDILQQHRSRWIVGIFTVGLLLAALPIDRSISAPALLSPTGVQPIVAGSPALIERLYLQPGQSVARGQPIVALRAPELTQAEAGHTARIAALENRLSRTVASADDLASRAIIESELAAERAALATLASRRGRLLVRAQFDGVLVEWGRDMHVGRWVAGNEVLGQLVRPGEQDVTALVAEDDARRIHSAARARFVPDDPLAPSHRAQVTDVGTTAVQRLDLPILASTNGGPVAVRRESDGALRPEAALYLVRLRVPVEQAPSRARWLRPVSGEVRIDAEAESLLARFARAVTRLFRSEGTLF